MTESSSQVLGINEKLRLKSITTQEAEEIISEFVVGAYLLTNTSKVLLVVNEEAAWTTEKSFYQCKTKISQNQLETWSQRDLIDTLLYNVEWHNNSGPATFSINGEIEWWIQDDQMTKRDFCNRKDGKYKPNLSKIGKFDAWRLFTPSGNSCCQARQIH